MAMLSEFEDQRNPVPNIPSNVLAGITERLVQACTRRERETFSRTASRSCTPTTSASFVALSIAPTSPPCSDFALPSPSIVTAAVSGEECEGEGNFETSAGWVEQEGRPVQFTVSRDTQLHLSESPAYPLQLSALDLTLDATGEKHKNIIMETQKPESIAKDDLESLVLNLEARLHPSPPCSPWVDVRNCNKDSDHVTEMSLGVVSGLEGATCLHHTSRLDSDKVWSGGKANELLERLYRSKEPGIDSNFRELWQGETIELSQRQGQMDHMKHVLDTPPTVNLDDDDTPQGFLADLERTKGNIALDLHHSTAPEVHGTRHPQVSVSKKEPTSTCREDNNPTSASSPKKDTKMESARRFFQKAIADIRKQATKDAKKQTVTDVAKEAMKNDEKQATKKVEKQTRSDTKKKTDEDATKQNMTDAEKETIEDAKTSLSDSDPIETPKASNELLQQPQLPPTENWAQQPGQLIELLTEETENIRLFKEKQAHVTGDEADPYARWTREKNARLAAKESRLAEEKKSALFSRIHVTNIAAGADYADLAQAFKEYKDEIREINIVNARDPIKRTQTASIDFSSRGAAKFARHERLELHGLVMRIRLARAISADEGEAWRFPRGSGKWAYLTDPFGEWEEAPRATKGRKKRGLYLC